MAGDYFCAYHSYLSDLQACSDEECGRLFRACLLFSASGEDTVFQGNERYIWPLLKSQIKRDAEAYTKRVETNRINGAKGGRPPKGKTERFFEKPTETERFFEKPKKTKEKEKEKVKEKENIKSVFSSEKMQSAFDEWIAYKKERREAYKPTGLKALISRLTQDVEEKGENAVIDAIHYSMAQGWKGIYYKDAGSNGDKAKTQAPRDDTLDGIL